MRRIETSPEFEAFVAKYPEKRRNTGKRKAYEAFCAVLRRGITLEAIMLTLDERIHCEWADRLLNKRFEFIPHMATFLRSEAFDMRDGELLESDPEQLPFEDAAAKLARAEAIRYIRELERRRWLISRAQHQHGTDCDFGENCAFCDGKEPFIPTVDEILAKLK